MTPASRYWWKHAGPKLAGGVILGIGVLGLFLAEMGFLDLGRFQLLGSLILIGVGVFVLVLSNVAEPPSRRR